MEQGFWLKAADDVFWYKKPSIEIDDGSPPFYRWFPDGITNICYNALDQHVLAGRGDNTALIYDSPVTDTKARYSYSDLLDQVSRFAGVLAAHGVVKGDRVIVYMPMIPQCVVAMLACARIGAVHSVVFGGFASKELAARIDDAKPKLIVGASCGIEPSRIIDYKPLLDHALDLANHEVDKCIIYQREQSPATMKAGRDLDWGDEYNKASPVDCVPVGANDPLYILYTSGTTGQPKGVVRDTGGSIVALKWSMTNIYNIKPGDTYWAASDVGWVVGHSYIVYGPLIHGNATVLYEGKPVGTPDPGAFWRVIAEHGVKVMFTAPTALRAIKREDPEGKLIRDYDLSGLQSLFLAGERCDPDTLLWAQKHLGIPVVDHWWQTETGWPICANCLGIEELPIVPGSPTRPVNGYDVQVLGEDGAPLPAGETGNLVVKNPLPPGTFITLWNADNNFEKAYFRKFPGYYETGDAGYIDDNGYVFVMSRTDDVINVAGHRLSTGAIEEVFAGHPDVAECAVFGISDTLKGQLPVGLAVLNQGVERDARIITTELIQKVRAEIGPVAAFKICHVVERLPKTRSGKILRATMRKIANGEEWMMPATVEDSTIFEELTPVLLNGQ